MKQVLTLEKEKKTDWKLYLLIFLIIYISKDTLFWGTNIIKIYTRIAELVTFFWFVYFGIKYLSGKNRNKLNNSSFTIIGLMLLCVLVSSIVNGFNIWVLIRISTILGGVFLACIIPREKFFSCYENIMVFIAGFSIGSLIVNVISSGIIHLFPIIVNNTSLAFFNLIFTVIPLDDYFRLFGPFREPGVFIVFLSVAILSHFLRNERVVVWKLVLLIAALILTFSTTGYITLGSLMIFYILKNRGRLKGNNILFILLFTAALFFLWTRTDILSNEGDVFSKLEDISRASTISRFGSIYANIQIFLENPILGVGGNLSDLFPKYCLSILGFESEHNTNTILIQFATFGVLYGLLFFWGFYKFLRSWCSPLLCVWGGITIFLMFSGENLSESLLPYYIIGYGLNSVSLSNKEIAKSTQQTEVKCKL